MDSQKSVLQLGLTDPQTGECYQKIKVYPPEDELPSIDCQTLISELHRCSLLQLLLPQNTLEQVVLSGLGSSILLWSTEASCDRLEDESRVSASWGSKGGHGPSLQVHNGIATEGNGLQVTGQRSSEEIEPTRFLRISGV